MCACPPFASICVYSSLLGRGQPLNCWSGEGLGEPNTNWMGWQNHGTLSTSLLTCGALSPEGASGHLLIDTMKFEMGVCGERGDPGWSLLAGLCDSPGKERLPAQVRSLTKALRVAERKRAMTLPAASLPSRCLHRPLSLSLSHTAHRPGFFRKLLFPFLLSMETQNSNQKKKKRNKTTPASFPHCLQNHPQAVGHSDSGNLGVRTASRCL